MPPVSPLTYPDPVLTDGRVGLRRWREKDVGCVALAGHDPEITATTTVPPDADADAALAFVRRQWARAEDGEGVSQAIVTQADDRAVGMVWVGLRPEAGVAGIGYWVVPDERGRGAASAAVRLVVPWALRDLRLRRLEARVAPRNTASQRVLHRAGFRAEGRLRALLTRDGHPEDALVYAVLPGDRLSG